jgi:hypothetical protein
MAENELYPIVSYERPEFDAILGALDSGLKSGKKPGYSSVREGLAISIAQELAQDKPGNENYASFGKMLDGTAEIYKHPGLFPDMSPAQITRVLAGMDTEGEDPVDPDKIQEGIIKLFAFDKEGRSVVSGEEKLLEAAVRGGIKGAGNLALFLGGAKVTNAALQAFPGTAVPVTPVQAAVRIVGPVVGGTAAVIAGSRTTDQLTDYATGRRSLFVPGTDFYYRVVEGVAEDIPFVLAPLGAARPGVNLGYKALADLTTPRELSKTAFGRKDPSLLGGLEAFKRQRYFVAPGRRPVAETRSLRITKGAEDLVNRMRKETLALGPLASEAGAVTFGGLAREAAKDEGASPGMQIAAEMGGGIAGGVFLDTFVRRAKTIIQAGRDVNRKRKELGGIRPAITSAFQARRSANEQQVGNFIWDFVTRYGEDPAKILKAIESGELDEAVEAYARANPGVDINVVTAAKSRSPAMLALSKAVADSTGGLGAGSSENIKIAEGIRLYLRGLYATGNPEAVSQVAAASRDAFETGLQTLLDQKIERVTDAFLRVTGKKSLDDLDGTQMTALGEKISKIVNEDYLRSSAKRRYLYDAVPDNLVVSSFKDPYGKEVTRPNVVSVWDEALDPDLQFSNRSALAELKDLVDYARDRANALKVPFDGNNLTNPSSSTFNKLYESARGTAAADQFDFYVKQYALDDGSPESLKRLSGLIRQSEPRADRPTDLSRLLRAKRDELVSLRNQAQDAAGAETADGITVKSLDKIRSTALDLAAATKDPNVRRLATKFAAAADADIKSLPEGTSFELDMARAYTKAHQDVYSRSFAGDIVQRGRDRGLVVDPSGLGGKIFSAGSLRSRQISDVGKFNASQYLTTMFTGVPERGRQLSDDYLKTVIDPESKTVDLTKARQWLAANGDELKELPGYKFVEREIGEGENARRILEVKPGGTLYDNVEESLQDSITARGALENVLRQIRAEAMAVAPEDPSSVGGISRKAITTWMNKDANKEILAAFPNLKDDLARLAAGDESALALLSKTEKQVKDEMKARKDAFSFYQLLPEKNESPVSVISSAITSRTNPLQRLEGYWKVIEDAPEKWQSKINGETYTKADAIAGFKTSVIDSVLLNAGANEKNFDPLNAYRKLFAPMQYAEGRKRLADWLVEKGVFTESEKTNIESFLGRAVELNETIFTGRAGDVENLMGKMGASADLILSVLGSNAGARLQKLLPGEGGTGTLIASGRGAKVFRESYKDLFEKAPAVLKMDILKKAMEDPQFMAQLLRKGKTEAEKQRIGGALVQSLIVDGYLMPSVRRPFLYGAISAAGESEVDISPVSEAAAAEMPPVAIPQQRSSLAPVAPVPTRAAPAPAPSTVQPPPAAPGPTPSGPVDRARFLQAFPTGPAADLAREQATQQGIGSLMGQ